ncbi:MAG: aconitase X [Desulfobaccales bacterium]
MQSATMQLTAEEESMLRGDRGPAVQEALAFQIEVGNFFGAKRFVPIGNAHFMGDIEVMGDAGLDHLRRLKEQQAKCMVETTTNAICTDFAHAESLCQDAPEITKEREIVAMLQDMGMVVIDTCINYQTAYQPSFGEHVAWGDTGTVIYANSIFGARTNYEGGNASLAASLTGRTPAYGFHLDDCRRGTIAVDLLADMKDIADWGAVGKLVGHPNQDYFAVPVFKGVRKRPSPDDLKHLGCALASYGSMAMYHMVGVSPEAPTAEAAFAGKAPAQSMTITQKDLDDVYRSYKYIDGPENLVVFSGPQLSIFEFRRLAELFRGRKVAKGMHSFITTNQSVLANASRLGYVKSLEDAGVCIMGGCCFYLLQGLSRIREENSWTNLVSNSGKIVNTITAHRFNTVLRKTSECVEIACTGELK